MGIGRNAVIGRAHRLKLSFRGGNKSNVSPRPVRQGQKTSNPQNSKQSARAAESSSWRGAGNPHYSDIKARAQQRAASPGLAPHLVSGEARQELGSAAPASLRLSLTDLTERTCKWPSGDPRAADFAFCGNTSGETSPYCIYHQRLAYQPLQEKRHGACA
jgi:GcrA cell cycle regulator